MRFVFLRTQFFIAIIIILVWGLSPIGGQSAARLLTKGYISVRGIGPVSYVHPDYQRWRLYDNGDLKLRRTAAVNNLYTTNSHASLT